MRLLRRDTEESVTRRLTEAGAPREVAEEIVAALMSCGLSASGAREWLFHPDRGHPITRPFEMEGLAPILLKNSPSALIERGEADAVLAEAREFAGALPAERTIARLFWGDIDAVRRLTRCDRDRTGVIAGIATTLLGRVKTPERVNAVAQTKLAGHMEERIVDRILAGEEDAVAAELADGRIDVRALERHGELLFIGW
jgi:hypothetical protein